MTKTNEGLVEYCKAQLGLPYWYATFGFTSTLTLLENRAKVYPTFYTPARIERAKTSEMGKRVHDCVGLIKGYIWSDTPTSKPKYVSSQDVSANTMYSLCKKTGDIKKIPETVGVLVFMPGHVGVYIGNGKVIECRIDKGVVETNLKSRPWKTWGFCPFIEYISGDKKPTPSYVAPKEDEEENVSNISYSVRINAGVWNIRSTPSATSNKNIIGSINGNSTYKATKKNESGWYYIGSKKGWIGPKAVKSVILAKETVSSYKMGDAFSVKNAKYYSSSATDTPAKKTITGTVYLYDGVASSGMKRRFRFTTNKSYVGVLPVASHVTGWIDSTYLTKKVK